VYIKHYHEFVAYSHYLTVNSQISSCTDYAMMQLMQIIVKLAAIQLNLRPLSVSTAWTERLLAEFFNQV
jgi:3'5'-cyclic nucleotide phosphodiesterase